MIAPAVDVVTEAALVAIRREAVHQMRGWLGVPSRKAHRQVDRHLGQIAAADDLLTPDVVFRWGRR